MKKFINYLEKNPELIIRRLKNNNQMLEDIEATIVVENKIFSPTTALDMAEIYEEILNIVVTLEFFSVELPSDVRTELILLGKENLRRFSSLAVAETKNDGNLAIFIHAIVNHLPFNFGLLNYNENKSVAVVGSD